MILSPKVLNKEKREAPKDHRAHMALFKPDTTSTRAGSTNSPEMKSPTGPGEDGEVGPMDAPKVNQDDKASEQRQ